MEIVARNLAVGHDARPVLEGIALRIVPGEMVGLIGPNGAGKTTLLRTLASLLPALGGEVTYDGTPAAALPARTRARRLAYLAQGGDLSAALAVEAVVALGRLPHRSPFAGQSQADRDAVDRAVATAELAPLLGRPLASLSGGERARVLLARALAVEAEMILADEPVASLDPLHQITTLSLLASIARAGVGVVVVLHDLSQAARFCDRLILVAAGRIMAEGPPDAVLTDALMRQAFGIELARATHRGAPLLLPWQAATTHQEGH